MVSRGFVGCAPNWVVPGGGEFHRSLDTVICGHLSGDISDGLRRCVKALAGKDLADQRQIEPPGHRDALSGSDFGDEQECFPNQRM